MRICFIGKYPPIEGGVSSHAYWLAKALGKKGHEVHVVTNAQEVEKEYCEHSELWDFFLENLKLYMEEGLDRREEQKFRCAAE